MSLWACPPAVLLCVIHWGLMSPSGSHMRSHCTPPRSSDARSPAELGKPPPPYIIDWFLGIFSGMPGDLLVGGGKGENTHTCIQSDTHTKGRNTSRLSWGKLAHLPAVASHTRKKLTDVCITFDSMRLEIKSKTAKAVALTDTPLANLAMFKIHQQNVNARINRMQMHGPANTLNKTKEMTEFLQRRETISALKHWFLGRA